MRILVCGDRDWTDEQAILREINKQTDVSCIIEGGARGADTLASRVADSLGIHVEEYPADWSKYHRTAGVIRNQQMLDDGKPDIVLAFHPDLSQSKGTADMVRRARKASIPVEVFNS